MLNIFTSVTARNCTLPAALSCGPAVYIDGNVSLLNVPSPALRHIKSYPFMGTSVSPNDTDVS